MLALPSATPMNLSSTEVICSRDTSFSSAMAMPSLCTSRASSCLSTLAASCSPRLMSKIAARCVPASSSGLLAIGGDPILHDLCGTLRILPDQGPRRRDLLLKTRRQFDGLAALAGKAHAIVRQIAGTRRRQARARSRLGERLHQRPQHQERDQQHQPRADDLLRELRDPGRFPERRPLDRRRSGALLLKAWLSTLSWSPRSSLSPIDSRTSWREALDVGCRSSARW